MGTKRKNASGPLMPVERITQSILFIRSQKIILDADLASLYDIETKILV